jgi:hypothetical protein
LEPNSRLRRLGQHRVTRVDRDRRRSDVLHEEEAVFAGVRHDRDEHSRRQFKALFVAGTGLLAHIGEHFRIAARTETIEVFDFDAGRGDTDFFEFGVNLAEKAVGLHRSDGSNPGAPVVEEFEMHMDFAAEFRQLRDRTRFVRPAIQERVQRLAVREGGLIDVMFARRYRDDRLAQGSRRTRRGEARW